MTVDELKKIFGVKEDQDLAPIFDRKKGAISVWRRSGIPAIIERRALELMAERGIVSEPETPYKSELFQLKIPAETQELIDKLQHLDKTAKIMMADVIEKMAGMTQTEQWQYVAECMRKLSEGGSQPPSIKKSS